MARPKKVISPLAVSKPELKISLEDFDTKCKNYLSAIGKVSFPDLYGMIAYLGLDEEEYKEYEKAEGYKEVCKYTMMQRKSWLMRKLALDKSATNGLTFLLSQPENGAIMKGETDNSVKEISVKLNGLENIL